MEASITPSEACEAAECLPSTLRAWHNRLGFLPRETATGWRKYTLSDLIAIRLMVVLTDGNGVAAHEACEIVAKLKDLIDLAARGVPSKILIGRLGPNDEWHAEKMDPLAYAMTALDFDSEHIHLFDLGRVTFRLVGEIQQIRGGGV